MLAGELEVISSQTGFRVRSFKIVSL